MKTLKQILTAVCLLSLASCTVYETTPVATQPPPPQPVVYEQAPAPAPAPAPNYNTVNQAQPVQQQQPVYNQPQQPAYNTVNQAQAQQPQYQQQQPTYNTMNGAQAQQPQPAYNYSQPVTVQSFYDELSPYGQWVNYGAYGYVWMPAAGADFTPYSTGGHWVYTEYGWTWASDYRWGWAPFHYGRWEYDAYYGWFWIPDTQWGPAWVSWRQCDGYYGWAPLGYGYGWNNYNAYNPPAERWCFVQQQYITYNNPSQYYAPRQNNHDFVSRSTLISTSYYDNSSRVTYAAGPNSSEVARVTGTTITPVKVAPASGPGATSYSNEGSLMMYRPTVTRTAAAANAPTPAPAKPAAITEVQPLNQRPVNTKPEAMPARNLTPVSGNGSGNTNSPQHMEPVQQQQQQPQHMQPAPMQQQTQHTEPAQTQPQQQAPQRMQPVQAQPQQQAAPQRTEPVQQQQAQPQKMEPAQQQTPQHVAPAQPEHMETAPQRTEPAQQQQAQPQKAQSAQMQPAKSSSNPKQQKAKPAGTMQPVKAKKDDTK